MTDDMAYSVYNGFMDILTNPDRQAANATAQALIADAYVEESDSINSLAGFPVRPTIVSIPVTHLTSAARFHHI